jgi:hypothetical protein
VTQQGFIYIWRDRKRKKFYVGCHWGAESDGYICSSTVMRKAFRRRPEDFKRRVIQRGFTSRQQLLEAEHAWLLLIPDAELGTRYYNLSKKHFGHWTAIPDEERKRSIGEKISMAPGRKEKIAKSMTGKSHSDATKQKIRDRRTGSSRSEETKKKIAESVKRWHSTKSTGVS